MSDKSVKSLGAMLLGLLLFFVGCAVLVLLRLCLAVVGAVDAVLARVERWIDYKFNALFEDW